MRVQESTMYPVITVMKMGAKFKGWRPEDIRSINAPALVMVGDADIVRPEHSVQTFRCLPPVFVAASGYRTGYDD
jgi:pimeloyl-ACP methyl ester carboxylesterase